MKSIYKIFLLLILLFFAEAQQCDIIYVAPNGSTTLPTGTRDNPADLNFAITNLLGPTTRKVYLAYGYYILDTTFTLVNGITLEGGFDPNNNWAKTNEFKTILFRTLNNPQLNPRRIVAVEGINLSNFRIQDIDILVDDATSLNDGTSLYGIYLNGCSNYVISRCFVNSGAAADGANGQDGLNGSDGADGSIGQPGEDDGPCCRTGGAGGSSWSGGLPGPAGGKGGDGGQRGTCSSAWQCTIGSPDGSGFPGDPGQAGGGANGGAGGAGGPANTRCTSSGNDNINGDYNGLPGADGGNGNNGNPGADGTATHAGGFFIPGDGIDGQDGQHGGGGGGGGGGGSQGGLVCTFGNFNGAGAGGGGGGEGGQGGFGGEGGGGGGGSFGIYLWNNGTNSEFQDVQAMSGAPGVGGQGGRGGRGGKGGRGALGGGYGLNGQPVYSDIGKGGKGGDGGNGGRGGDGGNGDVGVSQPIFVSAGSTAPTILSYQNPNAPIVSATFTGCTEKDVKFTTNANGSLVWFFGAGSNPSTATGNNVTTRYATQGRKTVTLIANGVPYTFYEFIDIRDNGSGLNPQIIAPDTICTGASITLHTTQNSSMNYMWIVGQDTFIDPSYATFTTSPFTTTGTVLVQHKTYNACCGWSDLDSHYVYVVPIVNPSINIVPQAKTSNDTVMACSGQPLDFIANVSGIGPNPQYLWYINNSLQAASGSPFYTYLSLNDGDTIRCGLIPDSPCYPNDTLFSNYYVVKMNSLPVIDCNLSITGDFEPGKAITFSTSATSGSGQYIFYWTFGNGAYATGQTTNIIYDSPGTYPITVYAEDSISGCVSASICQDSVQIAYKPQALFSATPYNGCAPLTVNFTNNSQNALSYLWDFGDGSPVSTQENPSHTYTAGGDYTVTLYAFGSNSNDTAVVQASIVVYPKPTADFLAYPTLVGNNKDSVYFVSNAIGATQWNWDFGDGNTSTQTNPAHYYASEGNYTVTLIVSNEYGCSDTITKTNFITVDYNALGIEELIPELETFNVYPNPFDKNLKINISTTSPLDMKIVLTDIRGRKIKEYVKENIFGQKTLKLKTGNLAAGMYFLQIQINEYTHYIKLIKRG